MSSAASVVGSWYGGLSMVDSSLSLTSRPSLTQTPAHSDQQWFEPCELLIVGASLALMLSPSKVHNSKVNDTHYHRMVEDLQHFATHTKEPEFPQKVASAHPLSHSITFGS